NFIKGDLMTHSVIGFFLVAILAAPIFAAIQTEDVSYKVGDKSYKAFVAWDDSNNDKRPGVMVVHEWWGLTDYPKMRARKLAELGYVGFAIDMYGDGKTTDDPSRPAPGPARSRRTRRWSSASAK